MANIFILVVSAGTGGLHDMLDIIFLRGVQAEDSELSLLPPRSQEERSTSLS